MREILLILAGSMYSCGGYMPEGNLAARFDEGAVCLEENYDLVELGWTPSQVSQMCNER